MQKYLSKANILLLLLALLSANLTLFAADPSAEAQDDHGTEQHDHEHHGDEHHEEYDPQATAFHHISDANVYTILDVLHIPLPIILYSKDQGWKITNSSKFQVGEHGNGAMVNDRYVIHHGNIKRIVDDHFPMGSHKLDDGHAFTHGKVVVDGKEKDGDFALYHHKEYALESRSTLDGGVIGGGITGFYDFSLTKNAVSMIILSLLFFFLFRSAARWYNNNPGKAPKGVAAVIEPIIMFIRDDVAIPFIGHSWKKYMPLLLSVFFFILGLNLYGQIPFLGGTNVTGNLTVTMVLAIIIFLITNFSGNGHYWQHIFWMPGVPVFIKPLMAFVEILGLFLKPITLMLRLAGNITAGHIALISFIGMIFIFGNAGQSLGGSLIGLGLALPLSWFMMALELIVAFVQALVFTMLAASYIGAAIEEHH